MDILEAGQCLCVTGRVSKRREAKTGMGIVSPGPWPSGSVVRADVKE